MLRAYADEDAAGTLAVFARDLRHMTDGARW
jgi:hypothetical protein